MVSPGFAGAVGCGKLALAVAALGSALKPVSRRGDAGDDGVILCDPAVSDLLTPESFVAAHWGSAAMPVAEGGRGAAWFIEAGQGRWVLRQYRRGGWAAKLSRDRYLWVGETKVRSVAEFYLLQRLYAMDLPVPKPVAAFYCRKGASYRAALLIERISEVRPLSAFLAGQGGAELWRGVGRTLARFHCAGVDHADLNANNILVAGDGAVSLIDFDRGVIRAGAGPWRAGNLSRLQRSLEKLGGCDPKAPWRASWEQARAAYDAAMASP